jgi:Flp pilus assembly pilin Flp
MVVRNRPSLLVDERGLTTVEYVIVLCLIAALSVGVWGEIGDQVKEYAERSRDALKTELGSRAPEADK